LLRELGWRLGYQDFLVRNRGFAETGANYAANVAAFIQYAQGKGTLAELQAHLATLEEECSLLAEDDSRAIDIRTIQKAKGLEWPVVLAPSCNAGIIRSVTLPTTRKSAACSMWRYPGAAPAPCVCHNRRLAQQQNERWRPRRESSDRWRDRR
jgi:superfamily I DNA/RNA helicase